MPISATKLHYSFKQKANLSNSEYLKRLSAAQIDVYLNEAKDIVFEMVVKSPEIDPEIRNHLRQIEKKGVCLDCVNKGNYVIAKFPDDFYRRLRQTALATRGKCGERELVVHIMQSDKLSESLKSPYWSPSFEYEETLGDEGEEGMYVWHNAKFDINKVCIDYIRKIAPIAAPSLEGCGSYINEEGETISEDSDFEIDSTYLWRKIVDVAVLLFKRNIDDVTNFQTQLNMIFQKSQN